MPRLSDRWRPPSHNDATAGGVIAIQRLGMILPTNMKKKRDSNDSGCQHLQQLELTQHTIVCPRCRRRQVSMTTMMDAIGALRFCHR